MPSSKSIMEKDSSQELTSEWHMSCVQPCQNDLSAVSLTETTTLDETLQVVKEKVWSFRNAWKGVSEVLCGFGVSPSILGYSSVPLNEEGYTKEHDEGEIALQKVVEDEVSRDSRRGFLNMGFNHDRAPEEVNLLHTEEEEEDINHGFAESARQRLDEKKSLTRSVSWQEFEDERGENKKAK